MPQRTETVSPDVLSALLEEEPRAERRQRPAGLALIVRYRRDGFVRLIDRRYGTGDGRFLLLLLLLLVVVVVVSLFCLFLRGATTAFGVVSFFLFRFGFGSSSLRPCCLRVRLATNFLSLFCWRRFLLRRPPLTFRLLLLLPSFLFHFVSQTVTR